MSKHTLFAYERTPPGEVHGLGLAPYEIAWQAPRRSLGRALMRLAIDAAVIVAFFAVMGCVAACVLGRG